MIRPLNHPKKSQHVHRISAPGPKVPRAPQLVLEIGPGSGCVLTAACRGEPHRCFGARAGHLAKDAQKCFKEADSLDLYHFGCTAHAPLGGIIAGFPQVPSNSHGVLNRNRHGAHCTPQVGVDRNRAARCSMLILDHFKEAWLGWSCGCLAEERNTINNQVVKDQSIDPTTKRDAEDI